MDCGRQCQIECEGKSVKRKKKVKQSWSDRIFDLVCNLFLILFVIAVFYPLYFVLVASFTEPTIVNSGEVLLYPKEFTLAGYEAVFKNKDVWIGYANTIFYTVLGTTLGTATVVMAGYALSRKDLIGRNVIMKLLIFTMYFSGGTIPLYLVVKNIGLLDSRLLLIILGSVSVYNIIVVRSFMANNIPDELVDAAIIDGCGQGIFFAKIVVPLSKAVISVMVLYIAVTHWNSYFNAMIFLVDDKKYPLQLFLRQILLQASSAANVGEELLDPEEVAYMQTMAQVIKYSLIVVATAPILCVYPFIQKYFVKGVMIGSVKG